MYITCRCSLCSTCQTFVRWVRARRLAVDNIAPHKGTLKNTINLAKTSGISQWTDKMDEFVKKQDSKMSLHFLQSLHEGVVNPREATQAAHRMASESAKSFQQSALKTANDHVRTTALLKHSEDVSVSGAQVFMDPSVANRTLENKLKAAGASITTMRTMADIIIVSNPAKPGMRNQTAAILGGIVLCTPKIVRDTGRGIVIAHKAASKIKRVLWISAQFQAEFPNMSTTIEEVLAKPGCQWKLVGNRTAH
jgi:hypothetical protein